MTYSVSTGPSHGSLAGSGPDWTYQPAPNYAGSDSWTYQVSDGSLSASATVTVTVAPVNDSPAVVLYAPYTGTEGFHVCTIDSNSGPCVVGHFTDPDGAISSYRATVDWGDGGTNIAQVSYDLTTARYQVIANHVYERFGSYQVRLTVTDQSAGSVAVVGSYRMLDAPLEGAKMGQGTALVGRAWSVRVACFLDLNPFSVASDFTASIKWGDGKSSTATIRVAQKKDSCPDWDYALLGSHTYVKKGTYKISISIVSVGGSKTTATASVKVQ